MYRKNCSVHSVCGTGRESALRGLLLRRGFLFAVFIGLLSFGGAAAGTTWYVDSSVSVSGDGQSWETAFRTIEEGMEAASDGATIIVARGVYFENVRFGGRNVILRSTDPLDPEVVGATIIDGGKAGPVVSFEGSEDETCVVSGFTIRNGDDSTSSGGGICGAASASPVHTRAAIRNNTITGNSARNGGGIALCDGSIENNTISGNSATLHGGGLYQCGGTIANNRVTGNTAVQGSGGGMTYCHGTIRNVLLAGNSAGSCGGGIGLCEGAIENDTVCANAAVLHGAGLYRCKGTIQGCIVWGNKLPYRELPVYDSSIPTYSCIEGWAEGGEGNRSDDPRFVDPDGPDDNSKTYEDNNYRLAGASPCIDAGSNAGWMTNAVDLDGDPRIAFGRSSLTVDMGAFEHYTCRFVQVIGTLNGEGGILIGTWASRSGKTYTVWSSPDLSAGEWTQEAVVASKGATTFWVDRSPLGRRKFYRVELQ